MPEQLSKNDLFLYARTHAQNMVVAWLRRAGVSFLGHLHMVATNFLPFPLRADWPVYLFLECVCVSAQVHRQIQRDTDRHTPTQRVTETTDTHRDTAVIFDTAKHSNHF